MANRGLSYIRYAKCANEDATLYEEVKSLRGAKTSQFKPNIVGGKDFADNETWIEDNFVIDGTLTLGLADEDLQTESELLGYGYEEGELQVKADAEAPFFGIGQIVETKTKGGKVKYKVEFIRKIKFKPFESNSETRKDSISYSGPTLEGTVYIPTDGIYQKKKEFDTLEAAKTALNAYFPQTNGGGMK